MGPLSGVRVLEIGSLGGGPYAGMLLADMGADVLVIERPNREDTSPIPLESDVHARGKRVLSLDLKNARDLEILLSHVLEADMIFEGFRPGVAERLGFGPDVCLGLKPSLVYGRITGWGQSGPLSKTAGHDINFIALSGALASIGEPEKPSVPLALLGDFAGGAHFLVMGMLAALVRAKTTGEGEVVDAAIVDGAASMMGGFMGMTKAGLHTPVRGNNMLDGAAHFYSVYETADGKFISLGAVESQFYQLLLQKLGLDCDQFADRFDKTRWAERKAAIAQLIIQKTQEEWCEILEGHDVCFAPVLDSTEAHKHFHNGERRTFMNLNGMVQPSPAPRFQHAVLEAPEPPRMVCPEQVEW